MDMRKPYAYLEVEAKQMEEKARQARMEIIKLNALVCVYEEQARSLFWAIEMQMKEDAERLHNKNK